MTKNLTQKPSSVLRSIMWFGLASLCAAVLSLAGIYLYLDPQIPKPETYRNVKLETPLRIYAEDGALLAEFGERRLIPIELEEVPEHFINALLDTEDKRFYEHSGIDFISLTNDVLSLVGTFVTEGSLGGGASTITMQLARNVSFSLERRFLRKFKEMLLSLKIEQELSKDDILELYINLVPFGKRAYGAQAAALTYYGKPLNKLSLAQLAMLAGIPQAPSAGNPINGPARALARRNLVLSRMLAQQSISDSEYQAAKAQPISAAVYARELDVASPYAAEWVRQQASSLLPDLYTGGYEIHTTIKSNLQAEAISAVRQGLQNYDRRHGYRGAEATVDPELAAQMLAAEDTLVFPNEPDTSDAEADDQAAQLSEQDESANLSSQQDKQAELLATYPDELRQTLLAQLRDRGVFGGLIPAAVLRVDQESAWVLDLGGNLVELALDDSTWARPYIHVDLRGPTLKSLQEILNVGDFVRLREKDDRWLLSQLPEIQGALISMDPANGAVRALVGGFDFYRNQYNHALQAARQPGSGFKPFVYSAALAGGVTPADIFMDAPLVFDDENLESQYRPDNDNNRYNGPTRLREALYRSINLVSMRVLLKVGAGHVLEHVSKFGFDTRSFPRNTQLAIGGGTMAVTPIDMARAYTVLANGGYLVDPYIIANIYDAQGNEIFRANHPQVCKACEEEELLEETELTPEPTSLEALLASAEAEQEIPIDEPVDELNLNEDTQSFDPISTDSDDNTPTVLPDAPLVAAPRVVDERNVYLMHSMLRDVIKRGTGRSARRLRRSDLAGKTGTTNDAADTWFNGYNPNLVTTVWVGFSNHEPLGARAYGSNTPLPIWIDYMEEALAGTEEVIPKQPPNVVTMKIDPVTGELAHPGQSNAIFEYFLSEFAPQPPRQNEPSGGDTRTEEIKAIDLF